MVFCPIEAIAQNTNNKAKHEKHINYKKEHINNKLNSAAGKYVEKHLAEIIRSVNHVFDNTLSQKNILVGDPFIIYDVDEEIKNEVYYYPILNNDSIVAVVSVMNTSDGYTYSITDEYVTELTQCNYAENDESIVYDINDIIIFENDESIISSVREIPEDEFIQNDYSEKIDLISASIDKMEQINLENFDVIDELDSQPETYTPSLITTKDTDGNVISKICDMTKYMLKSQGTYNLCWAASVATIVNYRYGTGNGAINMFDVCDALGLPYDRGQDIYVKNDALAAYGIYYSVINDTLSWTSVKSNIKKKYPFLMSFFTDKGNAHSVVGYGYLTLFFEGKKQMVIWNPGNKTNIVVNYSKTNTIFTYNNKTWTWKKTNAWTH